MNKLTPIDPTVQIQDEGQSGPSNRAVDGEWQYSLAEAKANTKKQNKKKTKKKMAAKGY